MEQHIHVTESTFTDLEGQKKRLHNAAKEPIPPTHFVQSVGTTSTEGPEDDCCLFLCCFEWCFSGDICTDNDDTDYCDSCFD